MSHRFQAIVFDFDYTLADSSKGVVECIDFALRAMVSRPSLAKQPAGRSDSRFPTRLRRWSVKNTPGGLTSLRACSSSGQTRWWLT